ncbi:MAG: hypothetical protein U1E59_10335 [Amaricoccus sp.]
MGVLNGWTRNGTRPEFDIVTGVSTGALAAPFAFLGPDWDDELAAVYTDVTSRDVFLPLGPIGVIAAARSRTTHRFAVWSSATSPRRWSPRSRASTAAAGGS